MEWLVVTVVIILSILGIIGSFVPVLPGPPLSWIGLLLLYLFGSGTNSAGESMSLSFLIVWLIITVVVTIVDYVFPAWITKKTGGSRYASRGATAGMLIGLFVPPIGILVGAILGAFLAELIFEKKEVLDSAKSAAGAFLGFLLGTGVKLMSAGLMLYYIFVYIA